MKNTKTIFKVICLGTLCNLLLGQNQLLVVEGALTVGEATHNNPGLIQYDPDRALFLGFRNALFPLQALAIPGAAVLDFEGNVYPTIRVGKLEWMTENLRSAFYQDGTPIDYEPLSSNWAVTPNGAWSFLNDDPTHNESMGKLYNWHAVATDKLCPTGWRVATDLDWNELWAWLGGSAVAAGHLKQEGLAYWKAPNGRATNLSGMSMLPSLWRDENGNYGLTIGEQGVWWIDSSSPLVASLHYESDFLGVATRSAQYGASVRCTRQSL